MPANDPFSYENNLCKMNRKNTKYKDYNIHLNNNNDKSSFKEEYSTNNTNVNGNISMYTPSKLISI